MKKVSTYLFRLIFLLIILSLSREELQAQVGINSSGTPPNNSAMLDIESSDKGLLMPRVALTSTNIATPVITPETSLIIYNTNFSGTGNIAVTPGYYFWNGTEWQRLNIGQTGIGIPSGTGFPGEIYIDYNNGLIYVYNGTAWVNQGSGIETLTSLADNGNGTITYTDENGTPVTLSIDHQSLSINTAQDSMLIERGTGVEIEELGSALINNSTFITNLGGSINTDDQTLTLSGTDLSIEDGNTVDLSTLTGIGTDDQVISLVDNILILENGGMVNLNPYLDNTDEQVISYNTATHIVTLSNGGTIDLSGLNNSGTDDQNLTGATLTGSSLQIDIEGGTSATVNLAPLQDGVDDADNDPTNEIELPASATNNDVLQWNGTAWVAAAPSALSETTTTLVDNGNGTFTYTNEDGNSVIFNANIDDADNDPTNEIELPASATNNDVLQWNGTAWVAAAPSALSETTTTLVDNADGTFTYTNEDGNSVIFNANIDDADNDPTNEIELPASATNNDVLQWNGTAWVAAAPSALSETTTTLVDNGNGTFTYTNEDGNSVIFNANIDDADNDPTNEIELPASATNNDVLQWNGTAWVAAAPSALSETTTTLVDNGNGTFTYTNEDGNSVIFNANIDDADNDPTNEIELPAAAISGQVLQWNGLNWVAGSTPSDGDSDPTNEQITYANLVGNSLIITEAGNTYTLDLTSLKNDADSDPTNEIELPPSANSGEVLQWDGSNWVAAAPSALSETTTTLVDNGNGTFTYTNEDGNSVIFNANIDDADNDPNNEIELPAAAISGQVLQWNGSNWVAGSTPSDGDNDPTNEIELPASATNNDVLQWNGTAWVAAAPSALSETTTTLVDNGNGTFTYTNEDGNSVIFNANIDDADNDPTNEIELPAAAISGQVLQWNGSNWVAGSTPSDGDSDPTNEIELPASATNNDVLQWNGTAWVAAAPSALSETTTTLVDNGNGTFTYTNEDGNSVIFNANIDDADNDPTNEIELPAAAISGQVLQWNGSNWVAGSTPSDGDNDPTNEIELPASATNNDVLQWNGTAWVAAAPSALSETTTTLVDNGNGTFTYTNEDGNPVIFNANIDDADNDPTNEIELPASAISGQVLQWNGLNWVAGSTPSDGDSDPTNEQITYANLVGNSLIITEAGNTYALDLTSLKNDADSDPTNEYNTSFTLSGSTLSLTDGAGTKTVDLTTAVAADDQTIDIFNLSGAILNLSLENDGQPTNTVDLSILQDGDAWGVSGENQIAAIGRTGNVGIGTTSPSTNLHVEGQARITNTPSALTTDSILFRDASGIIKQMSVDRFMSQVVSNTPLGDPSTGDLDCASPIYVTGTYQQNIALDASNTITINVFVYTTGSYLIKTTPINGYFFIKSGTFTSVGSQSVTLVGSGTPIDAQTDNHVFIYNGSTSACNKDITVISGPAIGTADCNSLAVNGTYYQNVVPTAGETITLNVDITSLGSWKAHTDTINGYYFSGSGSITTYGPQSITLQAEGTPLAGAGGQTDNFTLTFDSLVPFNQTCNFSVQPHSYDAYGNVDCNTIIIHDAAGYYGAYPLSSTENITLDVNFTDVGYTGSWTAQTDFVNGYSFSGSGTITASGPQTITLYGSGAPSAGNQTDNFILTFDNPTQTCNLSVQILPTPTFPSGANYCSGSPTIFKPILSLTGRIWMDRNLGANQVATNSTDAAAYGDLYQWGRFTDGHQCRTSGTTGTLASNYSPNHPNFITNPSLFSPNWTSVSYTTLWNGVNAVNNPCPNGFRLPTASEWEDERLTWTSNDVIGAFGSPLKLSVGGMRVPQNGTFYNVGTYGYYSMQEYNTHFSINWSPSIVSRARAAGISVRCIKD